MDTSDRYKLIKVNEKIASGTFTVKFYCQDPQGYPFILGNQFIEWLIRNKGFGEQSAITYLSHVFVLLSLFEKYKPTFSFLSSNHDIRWIVENYIRYDLGFHLYFPKNDGALIDGPDKTISICTGDKSISMSTLKLRINAWKKFYEFLIDQKQYIDKNPFDWENQQKSLTSSITQMPEIAGTTPEKQHYGRNKHREVNTYFCVLGDDWVPQQITDPSLPEKILNPKNFLQVGPKIITRILFEGGPRIHEVLASNIGNWRSLRTSETGMKAISKGSHGDLVKIIHWTTITNRMLVNYINNERRLFDIEHRYLEDLPDDAPIFLNRFGRRITFDGFYGSWTRACARAEVEMTIHQARHWFVTSTIRRINKLVEREKKDDYLKKFQNYMKWKSAETVKIYDHNILTVSDEELYEIFYQDIQKGNIIVKLNPEITTTPSEPIGEEERKMIEEFYQLMDQDF